MKFKKVDKDTVDLIDYVGHYIENHPETEIWVGADSQSNAHKTTYATVVALYNPGHGAHVIYKKWSTKKEPVRSVRLLNEVWSAVEVAEEIKNSGLPKPKFIDIDVNPNPKYKSNEVFSQAVGLCEGMGYDVRYKTLGPMVVSMADNVVRN